MPTCHTRSQVSKIRGAFSLKPHVLARPASTGTRARQLRPLISGHGRTFWWWRTNRLSAMARTATGPPCRRRAYRNAIALNPEEKTHSQTPETARRYETRFLVCQTTCRFHWVVYLAQARLHAIGPQNNTPGVFFGGRANNRKAGGALVLSCKLGCVQVMRRAFAQKSIRGDGGRVVLG